MGCSRAVDATAWLRRGMPEGRGASANCASGSRLTADLLRRRATTGCVWSIRSAGSSASSLRPTLSGWRWPRRHLCEGGRGASSPAYSETPRQCARPAARLGLFGRPAGLSLPPSHTHPVRKGSRVILEVFGDRACPLAAAPHKGTGAGSRAPCLTQSKQKAPRGPD